MKRDSWSEEEDAALIKIMLSNKRKHIVRSSNVASAALRRQGFDRTPAACRQRWYQTEGTVTYKPATKRVKADDGSAGTSYIDALLADNIQKTPLELVGIYFEPRVKNALQMFAKKGGRGAQSKLVNDLLKDAFIKKGLL